MARWLAQVRNSPVRRKTRLHPLTTGTGRFKGRQQVDPGSALSEGITGRDYLFGNRFASDDRQ
jgi:hypothetical protein